MSQWWSDPAFQRLTTRSRNAIKNSGLSSWDEIRVNEKLLSHTNNLGPISLREIGSVIGGWPENPTATKPTIKAKKVQSPPTVQPETILLSTHKRQVKALKKRLIEADGMIAAYSAALTTKTSLLSQKNQNIAVMDASLDRYRSAIIECGQILDRVSEQIPGLSAHWRQWFRDLLPTPPRHSQHAAYEAKRS